MDELTKILSGAILNIVVGILGLLFIHYLQGLLQSHSARGNGNNTGAQNDKLDAKNISTIALGFTIAVVASFFWGAGNAVSRYTLTQISEHSRYQAVVDVALIQYIGATSLILLIAFVCALFSKQQRRLQRPSFATSWGKFSCHVLQRRERLRMDCLVGIHNREPCSDPTKLAHPVDGALYRHNR